TARVPIVFYLHFSDSSIHEIGQESIRVKDFVRLPFDKSHFNVEHNTLRIDSFQKSRDSWPLFSRFACHKE
ncbi:hypothetical protein PFISCL1PPCAC_11015, partial [Pristionchus fissidentatus]